MKADHHRVARPGGHRAVYLARRHEGAFPGFEEMERFSLAQIHLALQYENRVVGVIVNMLGKLGAGLRDGKVQCCLLRAQARMYDTPRNDLAHAEGFAF